MWSSAVQFIMIHCDLFTRQKQTQLSSLTVEEELELSEEELWCCGISVRAHSVTLVKDVVDEGEDTHTHRCNGERKSERKRE